MKRFISYGNIETAENKIHRIQLSEQYIGQDENNEAKFDVNKKLSVITCLATEKIHGTNASVAFSLKDGFWVQSRTRIITPENDNHGTAKFAEENKELFINMIKDLAIEHNIDLNEKIIVLYYEWAGKGIQSSAATDGLDKMAIIFQHFKVAVMEPTLNVNHEEIGNYFLETKFQNQWISANEYRILNIMNFKTWIFKIDLNSPKKDLEKIMKIVLEEIEPNSPFGNSLGKEENIGEGVVLTFEHSGDIHRMKVKGEKHSKSKVKVERILSPEETAHQKKIQDFVIERCCTEGRLEQGFNQIMHVEGQPLHGDIKKMGQFLKWINQDIVKEESRQIEEAGLTQKELNKFISQISATWLKKRILDQL